MFAIWWKGQNQIVANAMQISRHSRDQERGPASPGGGTTAPQIRSTGRLAPNRTIW